MIIGIDGSRAFLKDRTGIEEYSYQVIKNLANVLKDCEVVLYLRENSTNYEFNTDIRTIAGIELPKNWTTKVIKWPRFWTQVGLSLEILLHPVDMLFIPAHTVPIIHPKKTVVTVHGLEYEFCPKAYSFWERLYMRSSIRKSCQWASSIIAVSNNTKLDLIRLYNVDSKKIQIIYEGCNNNDKFPISNFQSIPNDKNPNIYTKYDIQNTKYLLFIGRLEERKNVVGIVKAFETLKEQYKIPHKLVLAGKPGFGYEKIKNKIANANCVKDIIETGFISGKEKNELLKNADAFIFPSLYEGFGLPILEAQSAGVPVVTSNVSSIPEVANGSALLVDPNNAEEIADAIYKILSDENIKKDLVQKGMENIQRFSWLKCVEEIAEIISIY